MLFRWHLKSKEAPSSMNARKPPRLKAEEQEANGSTVLSILGCVVGERSTMRLR